jgi:hypothetical protein
MASGKSSFGHDGGNERPGDDPCEDISPGRFWHDFSPGPRFSSSQCEIRRSGSVVLPGPPVGQFGLLPLQAGGEGRAPRPRCRLDAGEMDSVPSLESNVRIGTKGEHHARRANQPAARTVSHVSPGSAGRWRLEALPHTPEPFPTAHELPQAARNPLDGATGPGRESLSISMKDRPRRDPVAAGGDTKRVTHQDVNVLPVSEKDTGIARRFAAELRGWAMRTSRDSGQ